MSNNKSAIKNRKKIIALLSLAILVVIIVGMILYLHRPTSKIPITADQNTKGESGQNTVTPSSGNQSSNTSPNSNTTQQGSTKGSSSPSVTLSSTKLITP